jgi:type IX secretion system PorP/SprF family membrane protein
MKMKKLIIAGLVALGCSVSAQQDPQYNLYQFNQLVINPAYAGQRDAIAAVIDYRHQWTGFSGGAPSTAVFSIHSPVMNDKVGIGLNAVNDQIGAKTASGLYANFSYILKLGNKTKLSFGARAGYTSYRFNYSKVNYYDKTETAYTDLANTNHGALDVDAGLFLKANTFFAGFSVTHLNNGVIYENKFQEANLSGTIQDYSLTYVLKPHMFFTMGKAFIINEKFIFTPSIMVRSVGTKTGGDINLNFFLAKRLWIGVFHKWDYGFGGLVQVYVNNKLKVGYSFDTGMGRDKRYLGPSHEIMIGFDVARSKSKMVSPRFL